jgi:hypothetical protein
MSGKYLPNEAAAPSGKTVQRRRMTPHVSACLVSDAEIFDLFLRAGCGDPAAASTTRAITSFLSQIKKNAHTTTSPICCFAPCERELHHHRDVAAMLVIAPHSLKEKNSGIAVGGVCIDCMRRWQKLSPAEATLKISAVVRLMVPDAQLESEPLSVHATRHGGSD